MTLHTKALDVACPTCGAMPSVECMERRYDYTVIGVPVYLATQRVTFHKRRISAAARVTRDANRVGRGRNG